MDELNQELLRLIEEVRQHQNSSPMRRKALNRLLRKAQTLSGIQKSSHQDYPEALNKTWAWFCQNIDKFHTDTLTLAEDLVKWINSYLYWRIHDLKSSDQEYWKKHISLNMPISSGDNASSVTLDNILPTTQSPFRLDSTDFDLKPIDGLIKEFEFKVGQSLIEYIKQDPDGKLRQCYPRKHPKCNAQFLIIRLFFQESPANFMWISKEQKIGYQKVIYHWKEKCLPLLRKIARELDTN